MESVRQDEYEATFTSPSAIAAPSNQKSMLTRGNLQNCFRALSTKDMALKVEPGGALTNQGLRFSSYVWKTSLLNSRNCLANHGGQ